MEVLIEKMRVNESVKTLPEYLTRFEHPLVVMQEVESLERIAFEVVEDNSRDGVTLLEVRYAPSLHMEAGLEPRAVIAAVWAGMERAMAQYPIVVRQVICGLRHESSDAVDEMARLACTCTDLGVVAFDMAGSEQFTTTATHPNLVSIVRGPPSLHLTLHSGEAAGAESVHDTINVCLADRIGHGVRTEEDPQLLKDVISRGVTMEMCPTSNVQTRAVPTLEDHPIKRYFDMGVRTAICTDNRTVSNVTLSGEFELIHTVFNMTLTDMVRIADHAFAASFMPAEVAKKAQAAFRARAVELLEEWGFVATDVFRFKEKEE